MAVIYKPYFVGALQLLCTAITLKLLFLILPLYVTNCYCFITNFLLCAIVAKLTFVFSKNLFLNERLPPDGKAVLITESAGGIGNALAKHLDKRGFRVFASCLNPDSPGVDDLRKSCSSRLKILPLDVSNDESIRNSVEFVKNNLGDSGTMLLPFFGPYTTNKFASVGFSEYLRYELDMWGIKVVSIVPDIFETDINNATIVRSGLDDLFASLDEDVRRDYGEEFLIGCKKHFTSLIKPSPKLQKIIDAIDSAISLKNPDPVYAVCENIFVAGFLKAIEITQQFVDF